MAWYGEERKEEADYFTYLRPTISGFLANEYADVEDAEEYLKSWLCPVKWQETSKVRHCSFQLQSIFQNPIPPLVYLLILWRSALIDE